MTEPYNPLDKENLGKSVADALLKSPVVPLADLERFYGAGVYALYYSGGFPAYKVISTKNKEGNFNLPIYVGSAVPPGGRRGRGGLISSRNTKLYSRLIKHRQSIEVANNLELDDFHCRYLIVDDIWIPLGESLLIAKFSPLWNHSLDGFGNHDPGGGRYGQLRSMWDTLHPGREWAERCVEREQSQEQIIAEVESTLRSL